MSRHYLLDDGGGLIPAIEQPQSGVDVVLTPLSTVITYDSETADTQTLASAFLHVARGNMRRVVLRDRANSKAPTRIGSRGYALQELSETLERRSPRPQFARHVLPLEASFFAQRWRKALEIVTQFRSPEDSQDILDRLFDGKYALMQRTRGADLYVAAAIGSGIRAYTSRTGFIKLGEPFRMLPAADYGRWIDDGFADVTPQTTPTAEAIDAVVGFGETKGMRLAYQRIVLPFEARGTDYILTASVIA